jgi:CRP/FNR family transcriptional regulator
MKELKDYLSRFPISVQQALEEGSTLMQFEKQTEILHEGQYVKVVPIVLEGVVKVFTRAADKELLLYYIETGESCIMSFTAVMRNSPSRIFAVAEENTVVALIPSEKLRQLVRSTPALNELFYELFDTRYNDLLHTIQDLLFSRMDQRLYHYLLEQGRQKATTIVNLRHREIAADLGTAREVVSRIMKKLENEGKILQTENGIKIL